MLGQQQFGQLGDGTVVHSDVPVRVANAGAFTAIAAGGGHTCGLGVGSGGRAWCWGRGEFGMLGTGNESDRLTPTSVVDGHPFMSISAGILHTCAVTAANATWCWGNHSYGQLGDGSTVDFSTRPVKALGPYGFEAIAAGGYHSCGIQEAYLACWGEGSSGQLGTGLELTYTQPVGAKAPFEQISFDTGAYHTCSVEVTGAVWCWGRNSSGQLGDDSAAFMRLEPVRVWPGEGR